MFVAVEGKVKLHQGAGGWTSADLLRAGDPRPRGLVSAILPAQRQQETSHTEMA